MDILLIEKLFGHIKLIWIFIESELHALKYIHRHSEFLPPHGGPTFGRYNLIQIKF